MVELDVGDKLFHFTYWHGGFRTIRQMQVFTIAKVNKKTYEIKNKFWKIPKSDVGKEYFLSKKKAYQNSLKLHKEAIAKWSDRKDFNLELFRKEVKYLDKKIREPVSITIGGCRNR
jgi:hypothetical protein